MSDFSDMTPAELEKSLADDLWRFISESGLPITGVDTQKRISDYLTDMGRHVETVFQEPTEAQKALRYTGRWQFRAKTAWGWLSIMRMQAAVASAREFPPIGIVGPVISDS